MSEESDLAEILDEGEDAVGNGDGAVDARFRLDAADHVPLFQMYVLIQQAPELGRAHSRVSLDQDDLYDIVVRPAPEQPHFVLGKGMMLRRLDLGRGVNESGIIFDHDVIGKGKLVDPVVHREQTLLRSAGKPALIHDLLQVPCFDLPDGDAGEDAHVIFPYAEIIAIHPRAPFGNDALPHLSEGDLIRLLLLRQFGIVDLQRPLCLRAGSKAPDILFEPPSIVRISDTYRSTPRPMPALPVRPAVDRTASCCAFHKKSASFVC